MKKGLISVIIPVYNCEPYLRKCVESVVNSDYKNLQIILIDDGSTDGSSELCDEFAQSNERIEVIHKENGGLSSARNAGLDIAVGEYVTFVDSDDLIIPDMLSEMYRIATSEKCEIVKLGMIKTKKKEDIKEIASTYCVMNRKEALQTINLSNADFSIITICGKLYLTSLFDELKFPIGMIHEDEYLTPRLFQKCERIAVSQKIGYLYMQYDNNSIMRGSFSKARLVIMDIFEERIKLYNLWGYSDLTPCAYQKYFWGLRYCYKKTLSDEYKNEHEAVVKRFKELKLKHLHADDKFLCICGRIGCLKFGEKVINTKGKMKYYVKRIFARLKR